MKIISPHCVAFRIYFTSYLCNVSFRYVRIQVWYEYTFDTSSLNRPSFSWNCDVTRLPFLGCDDYEFYQAGPLHWPLGGVTVQVYLRLFGVNKVKVKIKKIRYYVVLERAQGPTLLDCNRADTCFTVALGSVPACRYSQVPDRSTLYQHDKRLYRCTGTWYVK